MYKELTDIICRRLTVVLVATGFALLWADTAFAVQYLYFPEPVPFYIERPVTRALFSLELTDESNQGRNIDTEKILRLQPRSWISGRVAGHIIPHWLFSTSV